VMRGEGDYTWYTLIEAIFNKDSLTSVPGLVWKNKNNNFIDITERLHEYRFG